MPKFKSMNLKINSKFCQNLEDNGKGMNKMGEKMLY